MSRRTTKRPPVTGAAPAVAAPAVAPAGAGDAVLGAERELRLLQQLNAFVARSRDTRDADKALRNALRLSMQFFGTDVGCVAALAPGADRAECLFSVPREDEWDLDVLSSFISGGKVHLPDTMLARMRRRGRRWGALAIRRPNADFRWELRRAFSTIAAVTGEVVERIDEERLRDVRARIDRKIMEKIRPKDLFYQILDGLRSLTGYDHSASLLICDDDMSALEVVAEQIAHRKGRSPNIGRTIPLPPVVRDLLATEVVYGFRRDGARWHEFNARPAEALAELIDYNREPAGEPGAPPEAVVLYAPLVSRDGPLAVLRVAALHAGTLDAYEAELVSRFLPQASVAIQNSRRTESLETQMITAERKNAMADLARGVSHDVNNALGAVLPLVQQMRVEAQAGAVDAAVAAADLCEIERSLQLCRRIFSGMLRFARGATRNVGPVHLGVAVECAHGILREGLARREIHVLINVPEDLPPILALQSEVEQLLLNLLTNARDATPPDGRIELRARHVEGEIEVVIQDTGSGMPSDLLARIREPFFTTKRRGFGLGLAICRSIVAQLHGRLHIDSAPGRGTQVTITLAADEEPAP